MAENKKYIIRISGRQVEVSREVYQAYYGIERHTRTLDEKESAPWAGAVQQFGYAGAVG